MQPLSGTDNLLEKQSTLHCRFKCSACLPLGLTRFPSVLLRFWLFVFRLLLDGVLLLLAFRNPQSPLVRLWGRQLTFALDAGWTCLEHVHGEGTLDEKLLLRVRLEFKGQAYQLFKCYKTHQPHDKKVLPRGILRWKLLPEGSPWIPSGISVLEGRMSLRTL